MIQKLYSCHLTLMISFVMTGTTQLQLQLILCKTAGTTGPCTKIPQHLLVSGRLLTPNKQLQSVSMGQQWSTGIKSAYPKAGFRFKFNNFQSIGVLRCRGVSSVRRFCCTTRGRIPALRQEIWGMDGYGI